jgi:hypothetical protein
MNVCVYACTCMHACACSMQYVCICMYVCMCACVYVRVRTYACMRACVHARPSSDSQLVHRDSEHDYTCAKQETKANNESKASLCDHFVGGCLILRAKLSERMRSTIAFLLRQLQRTMKVTYMYLDILSCRFLNCPPVTFIPFGTLRCCLLKGKIVCQVRLSKPGPAGLKKTQITHL